MPRKQIAVITARADDSEQKTIISGIAQAAFAADADVAVFSNVYNHWVSDAVLNFENHIYDFFQPEQFDGVIVTAEAFMELGILTDVFARIRSAGIPAVIIGGEAEGFQQMDAADEADMERLTDHLISVHGLTQIDILTGSAEMPVSQVRVSGCRKAFQKHGLPFDESRVYYGNFWNDAGDALAQRYLSGELPMPQAVICTNDYMAFGLCDALTAAGVRIPDQITVTGYDHTSGRIYHHPILTTYRRDRWQLGVQAVQFILTGTRSPLAENDGLICGNTCACGVNSAELNEEIRAARIGQHHTMMNSAAQFTSRLTMCRTLAEYTAVLRDFYYLLHGAAGLYLCLDQAWNSPEFDGRELLCCHISGNAVSDSPQHFEHGALLPAMHEDHAKPMLYCFSPLCFQERLFGYTALIYDAPQCYDFSFRDWNKTVANALEFLRMKNDIHYLKQCQQVSSLYDALTGFYHPHEFRKMVSEQAAAGAYAVQTVKLNFPADRAYLYGETYRSDIISETAKAIKASAGKSEICCRAADDLFLILCRQENAKQFSEKLRCMIYGAFCGRYDESQVVVTYTVHAGDVHADAVDAACQYAAQKAAGKMAELAERKSLPHYQAMLALRIRLQTDPKHAPRTEEICKALCMSDGYFRVTYKKCFGVRFVQDCNDARIMRAKFLLCTTAMSIYSVALQCGYTDEKYFSRRFRQAAGCAPMQFRAQYFQP